MAYKKTITLGLDYSSFSAGVTECNQKMKLLDAEFKKSSNEMRGLGSRSKKLALEQDYLTQKIHLQSLKVEEAKKKYQALMDKHADTSKIDKANTAYLKESASLEELKGKLEKVTLEHSNLKTVLKATATVLTTITAGYAAAAKSAFQYCDDLATLSNETGISAQKLQEWEYASELVDVSVDTMTSSMAKMTKNMQKAESGTGDAAKAFTQLNVRLKDSHGHMRDSEDVFYDVIDALGQMTNQTERDQLAMNIFGKSAQDLAGIISVGSDGMRELGIEAQNLGLILSDEQIKVGTDASDAWEKFNSTINSVKNNIGLAVLPLLTDLLNAIAAIPQPILSTIVVILTIVTTIVTLVMTINSVVKAGKGVMSMISTLSGGMTSTYMKIISITVAITALISVIAILLGKYEPLQNMFNSLGNMNGGSTSAVGHNANGTRSWRGGPTWVGENGPEIIDAPAGSRIYSNQETKNIAGDTYNITINADISKLKTVNDVIEAVNGLKDSAGAGGEVFV